MIPTKSKVLAGGMGSFTVGAATLSTNAQDLTGYTESGITVSNGGDIYKILVAFIAQFGYAGYYRCSCQMLPDQRTIVVFVDIPTDPYGNFYRMLATVIVNPFNGLCIVHLAESTGSSSGGGGGSQPSPPGPQPPPKPPGKGGSIAVVLPPASRTR
jgi:hypothetical protein